MVTPEELYFRNPGLHDRYTDLLRKLNPADRHLLGSNELREIAQDCLAFARELLGKIPPQTRVAQPADEIPTQVQPTVPDVTSPTTPPKMEPQATLLNVISLLPTEMVAFKRADFNKALDSTDARSILWWAGEEAGKQIKSAQIYSFHLFLALLRDPNAVTARVLKAAGLNPELNFMRDVVLGAGGKVLARDLERYRDVTLQPRLGEDTVEIVEDAQSLAEKLRLPSVTNGLMFVALLDQKEVQFVPNMLRGLGADLPQLRQDALRELQNP